ncbi:glutathione peroxidase [Lentilactobacillus kefiri]|jgi:glutathione peroxidase|uniref:Glutathione peroxidase n=2 Tax=Lentilactobacillus kefiri TaxID=33962 RepID=A0A8E1RJZ1_LENKE|nr:glutathione peroxidase [Lentilactobacillus kefiri]KRL65794.1 peroxiredoxin [Lentilactobacillus parakefiri DSM 10551]KRM52761.1 peroxiredoxin [Lentilactobacillus kefiri DSM 20587 = JCM 5818]MCP9369909.1 glutathione peroxidase [Lentilactobacillus kefiri]MDH5109329.1 glutathione peroxidase [Lentilactobacillus kefiri]MDM7493708.1 glutathione peroxidase [Lentilactobacillus kefiri]
MKTIYDYQETEMSGKTLDLSEFKNKVVIIVNTASKCGLAPQLEGLEQLYKKYKNEGLVVLGLPSNQFHQELASDQEADEYCRLHYGVTFPMTKRVVVNGNGEDPLFTHLKNESGHGKIKWNYTKFLIGKDGQLIHRFAPITKPEAMEEAVYTALNTKIIL